ncbi:MAG: DegT/DnrJ/EryC1/StrS family aminotransferase [Flammeovirgaceae bacterium]
MENLKMVDLHGQYLKIQNEINEGIQEVINQTAFINGAKVKEFAKALGDYLQSHVIPCGNGTDALQIALMALEAEPGDEIILPVHTYVATAEVVGLLGLKPVFVDVDSELFTLDLEQTISSISSRTKAIVPVHLYGQCADMAGLMSMTIGNDIAVIEDTAQALGADYIFSNGSTKKAGTIGTIGTTSFFPSKNLGCYGDGGAMMSASEELAEKLRVIANHGQYKKYHHDLIGVNSRLDTIQAAVLLAKLPHLNSYAEARQQVAAYYDEALKDIEAISLPKRAAYSTHVFHQYTIKVADGKRDELKAFLASEGIPSMIYYPVPLHLQKGYQQYGYKAGDFPVAEQLSETVLSLPIHTEMQEEQQAYICDKIHSFYKS